MKRRQQNSMGIQVRELMNTCYFVISIRRTESGINSYKLKCLYYFYLESNLFFWKITYVCTWRKICFIVFWSLLLDIFSVICIERLVIKRRMFNCWTHNTSQKKKLVLKTSNSKKRFSPFPMQWGEILRNKSHFFS